jgi:fructose-1,6-bisphosphatase I
MTDQTLKEFEGGERITTLEGHIIESQREVPGASGAFSGLLASIGLAGKVISREVRRAGLIDILGLTGETNVQGEKVTKLDVYAHNLLVRVLSRSGQVCGMASEEHPDFIPVPSSFTRGRYMVCFDPLDGSSNIDVNASIGTIFGIWRSEHTPDDCTVSDILQPGSKLVGAGYIIYGSSTLFVYSTGRGVHGFTLDPSIGEFLLSHRDIRTPERGNIYSANEGNAYRWVDPGIHRYLDYLKSPENAAAKPYSGRYIGSLVADFHRNLLSGGIFLYPADQKNPVGKLRLMFEAAPLAWLCEQAGGAASTGKRPILDVVPDDLHARVPLIIGSRLDVAEAERFVADSGAGSKAGTAAGA